MTEHSIGKTIAELRKAKGWTQVELAERLHISDKTVSKWESEAGYPELTLFPAIADIFGVSIDYLMTGNKVQPEVVAISKAELCAKNDDVLLLKEIKYTQKDENNKCLIDYIKQYESLNVFVALCEANKNALSSFDIVTALKYCILSNHLKFLNKVSFGVTLGIHRRGSYTFNCPDDIMGLVPSDGLEHFEKYNAGREKFRCVLPYDFFKMIVTDRRISATTMDFLLGKQKDRQCVWYHAFPYMVDACYEVGNKQLLERLLTLSEENNQYAYDNCKEKFRYDYNYFFIGFRMGNKGHGLVRILDKTLKAALQQNDFEMIERMNSINKNVMAFHANFKCGVISDDEIRVAKLKLDKSVSKQEVLIQSAIHNGIVVVDELLAVKDVALIEEALEKYPISDYERQDDVLKKLQRAVGNEDWRYLFEYAVDHEDSSLALYVMNGNKPRIEAWLSNKQKLPNTQYIKTVCDFLRQNEKGNANLKYFKLRSGDSFSGRHSVGGLAEYIRLCKKQIIDDLKESNNTDTIIGELNEEFFRKEIAKGNDELVVVKLCVRLEAVLKSKYHYEGDFSEMLEKYCKQYGMREVYDEWGDMVRPDKFVPYLQKLRKYRNSIVHSERKVDAMTKEEIDFCIRYICELK